MERMGDFEQAPGERIDYPIDGARFLSDGDAITNVTGEITVGSAVIDQIEWGDTSYIVWVMGGVDGDSGEVTLTVTTTLGRIAKACFRLRIREC